MTISSRPAAATSIKDERHAAAVLYFRIQEQNRRIGFLSQKYDAATYKLQTLEAEIANTQQIVAAASHKVSADQLKLKSAALNAFVNDGAAAAQNPLFSNNESTVGAANLYRRLAEGSLSTSVAALRNSSLLLTQQRHILRAQVREAAVVRREARSALRFNVRLEAVLQSERSRITGSIAAYFAHQRLLAQQAARAKYLKWYNAWFAKHHHGHKPPRHNTGYQWLIPPPNSRANRAVAAALSYVGVPYVWGGASRYGVDCSGLVMLAWDAAGVYLPHYSGAQFNDTVRIPVSQLQKGDLLFYGWHGDEHVTMYIGHGLMVEAPYTGTRVHVTPVRLDYGFAGAGRVRA